MTQVVSMRPDKGMEKPFLLTIRAMRHCVWHHRSKPGYGLDIYELTEQCGVAAIRAVPSDDWYSDVPVALICSHEGFYHAEFLGESEPVSGFIYVEKEDYASLIRWLQKGLRAPRLYIYCDFDSHGLELADRIISQVPEATLYIPLDIESIWPKFGRDKTFNHVHFDAVKGTLNLHSDELQRVAKLMNLYKTGLPLNVLTFLEKAEPSFY